MSGAGLSVGPSVAILRSSCADSPVMSRHTISSVRDSPGMGAALVLETPRVTLLPLRSEEEAELHALWTAPEQNLLRSGLDAPRPVPLDGPPDSAPGRPRRPAEGARPGGRLRFLISRKRAPGLPSAGTPGLGMTTSAHSPSPCSAGSWVSPSRPRCSVETPRHRRPRPLHRSMPRFGRPSSIP